MASKKQKLQSLEKTLVETSDVALLRRDLNTMVYTLTQTLKGVLTVMQELSEAVEAISVNGGVTTIDSSLCVTGDIVVPAPKKKAPPKKPSAKRTVKKAINLDPQ